MNNNALIIDDEPDIRELLYMTLDRMDINCTCAEDISTAKKYLREKKFDLCLTDMKLPDGNGIEFVSFIQKNYPMLPVAVITAHGNMETAIQAMKSGAFDFITKPVDLSVLRTLVNNAMQLANYNIEPDSRLIGESDVIREIKETVIKLARSQAPVYISGESGVGKELVARMIHERGPRATQGFIPVNCGAIPPDLMESEFFGHKKGSFTGADSDKQGLFQAAEGGTLFLDEVAELPGNMQVKLLRAIQEKRIRSIGAPSEIPVNVRILSATHKDLSTLVQEGNFRQDLFYRINVIELNVPPLRERPEDIPLLANHFLKKYAVNNESRNPSMATDAMDTLAAYDFPGNIRELENIMERAVTLSDGDVIDRDSLRIPESVYKENAGQISGEGIDLDTYLENIERKMVLRALEKHRWNKSAAAKFLGLNLRTLRYRMGKLGINED